MGNKIRELRERLNISQEELSISSGVSRSIISQLETGKRQITTTKTLMKIAAGLGTTVSNLFFDENV